MRQAIERFLIESTPASRCLVGISAASPFLLLTLIAVSLGQITPSIQPALRPNAIVWLQASLAMGLLVLAGSAAWLWPRRQSKRARSGVELAIALGVGIPFALINCLSGLYATGPSLMLLGGFTVGLLLLQWRVMVIGMAVCAACIITCDALMWLGLLPYAAAVNSLAFADGQPRWWWRFWQSLTLYISLPVAVTLILVLFASHDALRRRLAHLAITDALTGLANRRHFMDRLNQELARQRRNAKPLTLVSLDADHFKLVNDQHGHAKGDEVLAALAATMVIGVRSPTDLVARMGGEEFALLLPETTLADAEIVCQRLQERLAALVFQSPKGAFKVSMSMGVTQCLGVDAAQALRGVDANLYQAKASGRDHVVCSVLEGSRPMTRPQ